MLEGLRAQLRHYFARRQRRPLLEASMAGAALVAMADGKLSFSEASRVDQIVERVKELDAFDPHEVADYFQDIVDAIETDPEAGRRRAHAAIAAVAGDPEAVALLVRICVAMSRADGRVDPAEAAEIEAICGLLGIDPATVRRRS